MWVCGFRLMTNGVHRGRSPHTQYKTKRILVCVCSKQDGSFAFVSQGFDISGLPLSAFVFSV